MNTHPEEGMNLTNTALGAGLLMVMPQRSYADIGSYPQTTV
jgi:hypothetical protein